ncbi:MAG: MmgE/PrpD family protein [Desulfobacterales bacterium]
MEPTHTDRSIHFIHDLKWEALAADLQHQAKRCLMDALGALIAGAETPPARIMANIAERQFGGTEATILVGGAKTSAGGAVLANGFAANALDIDDGYRLIKGHPGACVLPVILTAAEVTPSCSGAEFLTALIIGYELGIRAGLIRHARSETYHCSGTWGAIGGAAAAGRIMGLDRSRLRHALGAAEHHAPFSPMMKGIDTPSMGKDSIGWGAMVAMLSVLMAREGFTGIEPIFSDTPEPGWIEGLGNDWQIFHLYFKPYAACRWAQPAVDGALKIKAEAGLQASDISEIRIRSFKEACALITRPPTNTEEAQYNIAFPVAAALIDDEVGPHQVLPPRIFDSDLKSLLLKIRTEVVQEYNEAFPVKTYAEVVIRTHEGETISSGRMEPRWEAPSTLPSDKELEEKFCRLVSPILGESRCGELVRMLWDFEGEPRAGILIDCCHYPD